MGWLGVFRLDIFFSSCTRRTAGSTARPADGRQCVCQPAREFHSPLRESQLSYFKLSRPFQRLAYSCAAWQKLNRRTCSFIFFGDFLSPIEDRSRKQKTPSGFPERGFDFRLNLELVDHIRRKH